jgi:hypothetical protein
MVNVLSNMSSTICHDFIQDKTQMLPPIHMSKFSSNEEPIVKDTKMHKNNN